MSACVEYFNINILTFVQIPDNKGVCHQGLKVCSSKNYENLYNEYLPLICLL